MFSQGQGAYSRLPVKYILESIAKMKTIREEQNQKNRDEWHEKNKVFTRWSWKKFRVVEYHRTKTYEETLAFYLKMDVYARYGREIMIEDHNYTIDGKFCRLERTAQNTLTQNGTDATMFVHSDLVSYFPNKTDEGDLS